jgi:hypothetical protein
VWPRLIHALWRNFQSDFEVLLQQLRRHQRLVESQANIIHFEQSLKARETAELLLKECREAEKKRQIDVVRTWLASPNIEVDQQTYSFFRKDDPNSGKWLLTTPKFRSWFDPDFCSAPLLWISGIPGAGKTVLASVIVEEARKLKTATVAFFYCKYMDLDRNSFRSVARGILSQLLRQHPVRKNGSTRLFAQLISSSSSQFPLEMLASGQSGWECSEAAKPGGELRESFGSTSISISVSTRPSL